MRCAGVWLMRLTSRSKTRWATSFRSLSWHARRATKPMKDAGLNGACCKIDCRQHGLMARPTGASIRHLSAWRSPASSERPRRTTTDSMIIARA